MRQTHLPSAEGLPSRSSHPEIRLLRDAMDLMDHGFAVVPTIGKVPTVPWNPAPDIQQVLTGFSKPGISGVAVVSGQCSNGLAVMDFDNHAAYRRWAEQNKTLAKSSPTATTPRGRHVYFVGDPSMQRIIHVRGVGEYRGVGITVAPHSIHAGTGELYDWAIPLPDGKLPEVPASVFLPSHLSQNAICVSNSETSPHSETSSPAVLMTVEQIIAASLPRVAGERVMCLWLLARGLKHNYEPRNASIDQHGRAVERWHQRALPVIRTKSFRATWLDFTHAYNNANFGLGANPLDQAAMILDPSNLPEVAYQFKDLRVQKLIGWCAAIAAVNHNDGYFHLSSHEVEKRFGADASGRPVVYQREALRMFQRLVDRGIIERLDRGVPGKGPNRRSARYRWIWKEQEISVAERGTAA